jgi:hypothetical protein
MRSVWTPSLRATLDSPIASGTTRSATEAVGASVVVGVSLRTQHVNPAARAPVLTALPREQAFVDEAPSQADMVGLTTSTPFA